VAAHKKHDKEKKPESNVAEAKKETVSGIATETKAADPLNDFKKRMDKEEQNSPSAPAKKNYMWPILFIFIIVILLLVGVFLYRNGANINEEVNVVTLSPTPTLVPEPTKTIDLTQYEVEILNGSEISGEASRQQANLEEEGFTVSSIGNADSSDYTDTIIQAKADVDEGFLDKLKEALELSFVVGDQEELSEDVDSDVIVIIGSETN